MASFTPGSPPASWVHLESAGDCDIYIDPDSDKRPFIVADKEGHYDRMSSLREARNAAEVERSTKRVKLEADVWLLGYSRDHGYLRNELPENIVPARYMGIDRRSGQVVLRLANGEKIETRTTSVYPRRAIDEKKMARLVELVDEVKAKMAPLEKQLERLRDGIAKLSEPFRKVYLSTPSHGSLSVDRANKYDQENIDKLRESGPE